MASPVENEVNGSNNSWLENQKKNSTLWDRLGRRWPTRIDLRIDPISPRRWRVSAGLHATDTLWHAYIDFLTYSDDHPSRQSGLCPSRERSRTSTKDINGLYRSFPAVFEWLSVSKGYTMHFECRRITLWDRLGRRWPTRIDLRIDPISPRRWRVSAGLHATDTHCGMHTSIFSHTQMTTRAGSLVYVPSRERSRTSTKDINGLYRSFPAVFEWLSVSKGNHTITYHTWYFINLHIDSSHSMHVHSLPAGWIIATACSHASQTLSFGSCSQCFVSLQDSLRSPTSFTGCPFRQQIYFNLRVLVYKCLHIETTTYLVEMELHIPWPHWSAHGDVIVPRIERIESVRLGSWCISSAGTALTWML